MDQYPKIRVIFDRKKQSNNNTPGSVEVEMVYKGVQKRYSAKVRVLPTHWNKKGESEQRWIKGREDANMLNLRIASLVNSFNDYIKNLILEKREFTWGDFTTHIKSNTYSDESFLDFVNTSIESRQDIQPNTLKNHRALFHSLKKYNKIKHFSDITLQKIRAYDDWLREQGMKQTSIATHHKRLKIYINEAIKKGKLEKNPYSLFKIEQGKAALRKYLTVKEISLIENVDLATESLNRIRDLFLFQCYTGISFIDLTLFDFKKVIERDGKYIIYDVRQKTGEEFYIVLLSKAISILQKYDFKLPLLTNQQYNMRLKILADAAGIDKNLTSHMGRHTYASLCLNAGIQIEAVSKMLGHSNIKTTQIYAKMFNKTVEAAFDTLESKLSNSSRENEESSEPNKPIDSSTVSPWDMEIRYT